MDQGMRRGQIEASGMGTAARGAAVGGQPRLLLFTTQRWPMAALLANALAEAGLVVQALCPDHHPMRALPELAAAPVYRHLRRHGQLRRAIDEFQPDAVVPCDDAAVTILHEHHRRCAMSRASSDHASLIERSLGDPAHFELLRHKSAFVRLAAEHGVQTPATAVIRNPADLRERIATAVFPVVVKADGWSGGRGTRIARTSDEAMAAFEALSRPLSWSSAIKDSLRDAAFLPLWQRLSQDAPVVTLQAFAPGAPVNRAVVCRRGEVVAGRTFEAVETMPNNGNATVVRPRHIPKIDAAVERCVALLGLSGFAGFDFMYDDATGEAWLLEVNPRATSACYTAPRGSPVLAESFFAEMSDAPVVHAPAGVGPPATLIALFPQELERDPDSAYLRDAEQQAPLDQPQLIRACLEQATRRSLYVRLAGAIKRRSGHN